jgi:hypothetical protein
MMIIPPPSQYMVTNKNLRDYFGDIDVNGRVLLKQAPWITFISLRIGRYSILSSRKGREVLN